MEVEPISSEEAEKKSAEELFEALGSSPKGLSSEEARRRLEQFGPNELQEERESSLLKFLSYFWGPIPWMIEMAAVLSLIVRHWPDFVIIMILLFFNAVVGFWEEHEAANALDALKEQLALEARALRDGKWRSDLPARELVPGDVVRMRSGDIVPADVKLIDGDYLSIDQSALTGESLPVVKNAGDLAYSGSTIKQGEMGGVVAGTGINTFFGRTAELVEEAGAVSHFQQAVMRVGDFLIFTAIGLSAILVVIELIRGIPIVELIQFVLILVVASIPVAMPAVLSVTMALGALALSRMKAIVSRLQSIEEMAGIDILCSDKTGTLTLNKLTLGDPVAFGSEDPQDLVLAGALASREENRDAIDEAVIGGLKNRDILNRYAQTGFVPFDPVHKRTEATVKKEDGGTFKVTKGAPQVILRMVRIDPESRKSAEKMVDEFASKGYRTIGVARTDGDESWKFLGILPLYDPPREDSARTISDAIRYGIRLKMITGDNLAIGREIARELGMGTNIQAVDQLFDGRGVQLTPDMVDRIEEADGFAQVFPEHKYNIVRTLQERGHLVAMTGDGVNDAPALKQAEVGIAVSGATNAAQSAADLVLTEPGLGVIIKAVEEARRIFERMMSYTIYRIAMTLDIMVFVVIAMLAFNYYPITPIMIILLALLDDIPIMTIAYDNAYLNPAPVRWEMHRVLSISSALGFLAVLESFGLLLIGKQVLLLDVPHLQSMIYLQLVAGGHLMLFLTRTKTAFWLPPYPSLPLFTAIVATQAFAVAQTGFGLIVPQLPWYVIGVVWAYNLVWMLFLDSVKLGMYQLIEDRASHKRRFYSLANRPLSTFRRIRRK